MNEELDYAEILKKIEERTSEMEAEKKEMEAVKAALVEAENLYRKMARRDRELKTSTEAKRAEIRSLEKEADRLLRLKDAEEKRNRLLEEYNRTAAKLDELTASATWREFSFEHQIEGAKRLAVAKRGILADKRGLGKTLTSLIYLDMVQAKKVLVITPNDVVPQFEQEIQHWASHRKILSFAGLDKTKRTIIYPLLTMLDAFVVTLNYEAWRKDKTVIDDLVNAQFDTIILDEAHRIKSSEKLTAKGVFQVTHFPNICPNCDAKGTGTLEKGTWFVEGARNQINPNKLYHCYNCDQPLMRSVENVLTMTGTPILNKPQELFSLLHLVDAKRFEHETMFLRDFCYQAGPNRWQFTNWGLNQLTQGMSEFYVQRNREDAGIHIPPPAITVHKITPDKIKYAKQWEAYRTLTTKAALVLESGEAISMLYILEIILRERQLMTWPAGVTLKIKDEDGNVVEELHFDVEESQKLDEVEDFLTDLAEEEERCIIFSKFKAPLYELKKRFEKKGVKVTTATGDDIRGHKETVRMDFDLKTADPENYRWQFVFATFDAFATGVNLNAARHIVMIDDEWNPGMEDQAIGRIDRLNSVDQANVHIFRVKESIDEFMEALLEQKRQLTDGFESTITAADLLKHLRGE